MWEFVDLLTSDIAAIAVFVLVLLATAHTGVLQVREFRDRTGEDGLISRFLGWTFVEPKADRFHDSHHENAKGLAKRSKKRTA